ncbi:MAG: hypothetical protein HZB56_14600 [Deltaproteobacteria bacterium]|nr:hypothetical protein [Deltaproteobacteria bacterium]
MIEVYGTSMGLTLEARRFLKQMEQLKRLALNAEILAVRVTDGGEVFQTLAREIGRMASHASQVIRALHGHSVEVAAKAVRSAALARACEKYQLAVARGTTGATLSLVEARRDAVGSALIADIRVIAEALQKADTRLLDLARLNVELPMVATLLNIEANRDASSDPALTSAAKSLVALKTELATLLERIQAKSHQTLCLLAGIA